MIPEPYYQPFCTQLFIRDLQTIKTLVVQFGPGATIEEVKEKIRREIGLPRAMFNLAHGGRVLSGLDSLENFPIAHNSTLTCNSLQANYLEGEFLKRIRSITVKDFAGNDFEFVPWREMDWSRVTRYVRGFMANELGVHYNDIKLIHAGQQRKDEEGILNPLVSSAGDMLWHVVLALGQVADPGSDEDASDPGLLPKLKPPPPSHHFKWQAKMGVAWVQVRGRSHGGQGA